MSTLFDMDLFLSGALTGSYATRKRHLRQGKIIQVAISERWGRDNPWSWKRKHLEWFLHKQLNQHAELTCKYYLLTAHLIAHRLEKSWRFKL